MKYQEILNQGSKILKLNDVKSYNLDSEILLSSSLKLDRSQLLLNLGKIIENKEKEIFFNFIDRRSRNEPVAYITGYKEFWKSKFKVNKNVLIPRPDTETIIEQVLKELDKNSSKKILDIGTGSGCIIISILNERKKCSGVRDRQAYVNDCTEVKWCLVPSHFLKVLEEGRVPNLSEAFFARDVSCYCLSRLP